MLELGSQIAIYILLKEIFNPFWYVKAIKRPQIILIKSEIVGFFSK